jgi:hypothetical protein
MQMKKSILAMLFVMFGLVAVPLAYADEEMSTDDSNATAAQDEPLPPMMEDQPAAADDSGS